MAIPTKIKQLANDVRNKIYGKDVRESIAKGMEESGDIAEESNRRSKSTADKQNELESRYDVQVGNMTEDSEILDSRVSAGGGTIYPNLKKRLDEENISLKSTLNLTKENLEKEISQTKKNLSEDIKMEERGVNVKKFGALGDGVNNDTESIEAAEKIANGGILFFSPGNYKVDADFVPSNNVEYMGINATLEGIDFEIMELDEVQNTQATRATIGYRNASSVYFSRDIVSMLGFRYRGSYKKRFGKTCILPRDYADINTDLGCQSTVTNHNWYAIFAVYNGSRIAEIKIMPYFRIASINNNEIILGDSGENADPKDIQIYDFTQGSLLGSEVLKISRKSAGNDRFDGRVTKIVDHTNSTLKLEDASGLGIGNFLLPAPKSKQYCYLGSFYVDSQEVRNIADTGTIVKYRGVEVLSANIDGDISSGATVDFTGVICPLASAGIYYVRQILSTASPGTAILNIGMDKNHDYDTFTHHKNSTNTMTAIENGLIAPFLFSQQINIKSAGTLGHIATRQIHVRGWIEN